MGREGRDLAPRTERRLAADDFHWFGEHGPPVAATREGACLLTGNDCLMHSEEGGFQFAKGILSPTNGAKVSELLYPKGLGPW